MIKVLPKILALLELFRFGDEITFAEVQRRTGLTKSNVSHLLSALCECDMLVRSRHGSYRRGERLVRLCGGDNIWQELKIMGDRYAGNIVGWFNELTVVGIRFQGRWFSLVKRKPVKNLQLEHGSERYYPATWYETASGRVLLAYAPEGVLVDTVRHFGLPPQDVWREAGSLPKLKAELDRIHACLCRRLREEYGLRLLDVMACPHDRDMCDCRKPKPGMLLTAASRHDLDLSASWMVGDQA